MGDRTKIEWADATWNPIRGCARVSEGCRNCYAEHLAARFSGPGQAYAGLATLKEITLPSGEKKSDARWTGAVHFYPEKLGQPLAWKNPRRIFVNSTSDLFYERLEPRVIDQIFAVMALAEQHTFQVLTKRVSRMRAYTHSVGAARPSDALVARLVALALATNVYGGGSARARCFDAWPPKHIWLGASAENQETYDARRHDLENTNAAVVWWSLEPLLGPIRLNLAHCARTPDWVVVGGESGPDARPMHPDWARRIRDDCLKRNIPFFFKQWGEWVSADQHPDGLSARVFGRSPAWASSQMLGNQSDSSSGNNLLRLFRTGKSAAGRLLDRAEWSQYPQ